MKVENPFLKAYRSSKSQCYLAAHLLGVTAVMEVPGRLPTMVVLSRSKGRRAELVGDVNEFESVVGRGAWLEMLRQLY